MTLASIVEKEAQAPAERPLIAAVYRNRLDRRIGLAADPTVIYALKRVGRWNGNIRREDLRMDSPYNTYRYAGLPPGPICSPGLASLVAAAAPADVPYLYFVSRNDGTHVFAADPRRAQPQRRYLAAPVLARPRAARAARAPGRAAGRTLPRFFIDSSPSLVYQGEVGTVHKQYGLRRLFEWRAASVAARRPRGGHLMNIPEEFGKYLLLKKLTEDPLGETFRAGKVGKAAAWSRSSCSACSTARASTARSCGPGSRGGRPSSRS